MTEQSYIGDELTIFANAIKWKQYFKAVILPYIGDTVLEVGAGIGATTKILCSGNESLWVCLEPDSSLKAHIDIAISDGSLPLCCESRLGITRDLIPNERYNTILYIDVLEHIEDDFGELNFAARFLYNGGYIIVLSPMHEFLYSPFDRAIGHFRRYDYRRIESLTPSGCTLHKVFSLDSLGLLTSLANKLFLRQSMPSTKQILFWDRYFVPVSRLIDRIFGYKIGRSVLAVWKKTN
jgi:hypothetical protein